MIDTTLISFLVLAIASVASSLGVILFRNAVHSALSLILTLLFLALFYLQLGAMFIAIVQILIYAGAIMVLFLFVVTMLASESSDNEPPDRIPWQRGIAAALGFILVGALSYLLFTGASIDGNVKASHRYTWRGYAGIRLRALPRLLASFRGDKPAHRRRHSGHNGAGAQIMNLSFTAPARLRWIA